jgi:hypothetical protein
MPVRPSRARTLAGVARDSTPLIQEGPESSAATLARASANAPNPPVVTVRTQKSRVAVAATVAAVLTTATLAVVFYRYPSSDRAATPSGADSKPPAVASASPSVPTPPNSEGTAGTKGLDRTAIDERLAELKATASRQVAAGERPQLLDTLSAGLYLDGNDVVLNRMIDDLKRTARQFAVQARANAARHGATEAASPEFRDGLARERDSESFDRSGDRTQAIRALWAATDLYDRASATARRAATAAPAAPSSQTPPPLTTRDAPPPPLPERPPTVPAPTAAPAADKPTPPAAAATPLPPTSAPMDVARDTRASDLAAIHETLDRYADAYRNRDVAAVRKVLPSLSAQQLRSLEKDLSDYRSYSVEIADPRISIDRDTAAATGQVTRSFVTKSGVAGGHTVAQTFHLRKIDGGWVIERLESR